jgi:hypothetical protein
MLRLLMDNEVGPPDAQGRMIVAAAWDQQWRTIWKAQKDGYLDEGQYLTDAGREWIASERERLALTEDELVVWRKGYGAQRW